MRGEDGNLGLGSVHKSLDQLVVETSSSAGNGQVHSLVSNLTLRKQPLRSSIGILSVKRAPSVQVYTLSEPKVHRK